MVTFLVGADVGRTVDALVGAADGFAVVEQNKEPVPQYPHFEQQWRGLGQIPFPTEPLAQVPLVVGDGVGGRGVGAGVVTVQYADPVPQYPHCEQQRRGLEQAPFPTEPLPQLPLVVGDGVGGRGVGAGVVAVQ